jgi:hypothetical protein
MHIITEYIFRSAVSCYVHPLLCSLVGQDIRVTSIENGHGGTAEELATGSSQLDLFVITISISIIPVYFIVGFSLIPDDL